VVQNENKSRVKWQYPIFILFALMSIPVLFIFDESIWLAARDLVEPDYYDIAKLFTKWGLYLFYAIFAGLWVYALVRKNRKFIHIGLAYLKAQLVFSLVVVRILKVFFGRVRPGHGSGFTFFGMSGNYNAFPSGHSADAFVSGVFLYYLLKQTKYARFRFLPLIYAFLIALSRVFVSAHFPSDVVAGMTIGILGAWFFISRSQNNGD
jgi:membrane-associated phospholipid phosphatase